MPLVATGVANVIKKSIFLTFHFFVQEKKISSCYQLVSVTTPTRYIFFIHSYCKPIERLIQERYSEFSGMVPLLKHNFAKVLSMKGLIMAKYVCIPQIYTPSVMTRIRLCLSNPVSNPNYLMSVPLLLFSILLP